MKLKKSILHVLYNINPIYRLKGAKNTVVRDYVLPDYTHIKRGYVKVGEMLFSFSLKWAKAIALY